MLLLLLLPGCACSNRGIWGTAGIDGANIDTGIANDGDYLKVISWS
jgi:hypothetical protein